jgi:hypothetical protein
MIIQAIPVEAAEGSPVNATPVTPIINTQGPVPVQPVEDEEVEKAKGMLNNLMDWLNDTTTEHGFKAKCEEQSKKTGIPAKAIAKNFVDKLFGTVGDILGIAIGTVKGTISTVVDLIGAVLKGAVGVICNVASSIARLITFNKTCAEVA